MFTPTIEMLHAVGYFGVGFLAGYLMMKEGAMSERLDCPFCGSDEVQVFELHQGIWAVSCDNCEAFGPHKIGKEKVEAAWNTRHPHPCQDHPAAEDGREARN